MATTTPPGPQISVETVCRIVVKARQFDAKEGGIVPDDASDAADDEFRAVLEDLPDDPVYQELKSFIDGLDIDDQCEIVALMWMGRGDFDGTEWQQAVEQAREEHSDHTAEYLLGTPLLADLLTEGLAQFDMSCEDFEKQHFS